MNLEVLHLDGSLAAQAALMSRCAEQGADMIEARGEAGRIRLWGWDADLAAVAARLPVRHEPTLTFMGSGDFHHVTAMLLQRTAEFAKGPITVVHFDNHPDWVHFKCGMHCGSWVNRALAIPEVAKVITVGVCSNDLVKPERKGANLQPLAEGRVEVFAYEHAPSVVKGSYGEGAGHRQVENELHWNGIGEATIPIFIQTLLSRVGTDAIYITLDKDVMAQDEAVTNWDQGQMRCSDVEDMILALGHRHRIVAADVIGDYSPIQYSGRPWSIAWKRAESLIDQPRVRKSASEIVSMNERVNLSLLSTFATVMA